MTTSKMIKIFAKVLKDAPDVELSPKVKAQIKSICKEIKKH